MGSSSSYTTSSNKERAEGQVRARTIQATCAPLTDRRSSAKANGALVAHLGKDGMLLAVSNSPLLLRKAGDKIHQTAAAIKGLLGDCAGTDLLKEAPRLFQASATYIEANVDALCNALVLEVVRVRPILLHDRMVANKTVKTGMMHN